MRYRITIRIAIQCLLISALLPINTNAQEALPPVDNVRVENGFLIWDPLVIQSEIRSVVYNIYSVAPTTGNSTGINARYIATVVNKTEFEPALPRDYIVIAGIGGRFSVIDEATVVSLSQNIDGAFGLSSERRYEIRTNRCDNLVSGQSCIVACDISDIPTGGACRANDSLIIHQRARFNGFECIATADVTFIETDVFCLK